MKKGKRICFYGAAGSGKTTLASKIFVDLKIEGFDVAYVPEWIKQWAIQGKFPTSHQQLFVFANQQNDEDELLPFVDGIITDSPLLMNAAYSQHYGYRGASAIIELSNLFEQDYPGIHFWIERKHAYRTEGRYQSEEEALKIGESIKSLMKNNLPAKRTWYDLSYEDVLNRCREYLEIKS